jgi:transcriptional regulator with XRE-family HTH domain
MSKLKRIREEKNITQSKLSEVSGVNLRILQYYEQGYKDINNAKGITLYKIAQALECKIEDLLETT